MATQNKPKESSVIAAKSAVAITLFFTLLILSVLPAISFAQGQSQNIRGTVIDKQSLLSLPGAIILVTGSNPLKVATSDSLGNFKLTEIQPARYDLKISCMGYKEIIVPNIQVTNGKEVVLEIGLEENIHSLTEVMVSGTKKNETNNNMTTVSGRSFSMEEVNRYAGGLGDPSRLVANFAGVVTPNDQRNDIIIRGNSPQGVLWRVDGLNVPNLNHFSALGNTGGTNSALNTNVLKTSDFITSAFAPEYGNALAGVFDIGFRKGNSQEHEFTLQMGMFTGLEAMAEGPLNKRKGASYLIAYRHAVTSLIPDNGLTALPKYKDLSFKISGGQTKAGTFSLFGLGGTSNIDLLHSNDSTTNYADPTRDIYNRSTIGLIGLSHLIQIGKKSYLKTVLGANYANNNLNLDSVRKSYNYLPVRIIEQASTESHMTINTAFNSKINSRLTTRIGVIAEQLDLNLNFHTREYTPYWQKIWDYKNRTFLTQQYAQFQYNFTEQFSATGGFHTQQLSLNGSISYEPRLALKYKTSHKGTLTAGFGMHEQMQPLTIYFFKQQNADSTYNDNNQKLGFSKSKHFVIGYDFLPADNWRIKTEAYLQLLSHIPVSVTKNSFSVLNEGASFIPTQQGNLENKGTGTNYGIELTVERFFTKGYYGLLTTSLYQSRYIGSDGVERNTAFNGKYTFNFLAGKEFKVGKNKQNLITISTKFTTAGGRYYTPVDLVASQAASRQVLKGDDYAYTERLPAYLRLDIKFGYTHNSKRFKLSQSLFFDLQNITGNKNVYALQYSKVTNQVKTIYQFGFLPNFIYRIQF